MSIELEKMRVVIEGDSKSFADESKKAKTEAKSLADAVKKEMNQVKKATSNSILISHLLTARIGVTILHIPFFYCIPLHIVLFFSYTLRIVFPRFCFYILPFLFQTAPGKRPTLLQSLSVYHQ